MRKVINLLIAMTIIFIVSNCNLYIPKEEAKSKVEMMLGSPILCNIEVYNYEAAWDWQGSYNEGFRIKLNDSNEFIRLFKKANPSKFTNYKTYYLSKEIGAISDTVYETFILEFDIEKYTIRYHHFAR